MSEVLKACGHNPDLCLTVTGFGDAGAALVASRDVDKIIFTGSPEVCVRACARRGGVDWLAGFL